jgi:RNA polymerase sigma-70 factor, ECF subfamily
LKGLGTFKYEHEGDFTRWLARVADNAFRDELDRLHAGKRDIRKERSLDDRGSLGGTRLRGSPLGLSTTTPSMIMSEKEDLARLERAMDTLKAEHREVIVLARIEGLPYSEIADRLGKSVDAVKMLASRAIVALAKAYGSA